MPTPEDRAREQIDRALERAGWIVQDTKAANLSAGRGVALRNFPLASGHGVADYLLYVDGKAAGVVEAKKEGFPLVGVEVQAAKYSTGLPSDLPAHIRPLPFLYQSTGVETRFTSGLDPEPRSRRVFSFHRPDTLASWVPSRDEMPRSLGGASIAAQGLATLRARLKQMPPLKEQEQIVAEIERRLSVIDELEASVEANLTRADRLRQSILSQAFSGRLGKDALEQRIAGD